MSEWRITVGEVKRGRFEAILWHEAEEEAQGTAWGYSRDGALQALRAECPEARGVVVEGSEKGVVYYTTAPPAYDGFGTRTVEEVGRRKGTVVRKVLIRAEYVSWQTGRYMSGLHLAVGEDEWRKLLEAGLVEEGAHPESGVAAP